MSETSLLKNGIPCFDNAGAVTMIPKSQVDTPFGLVGKTISFDYNPNGAGEFYILISEIGTDPVTDGFKAKGFIGLAFRTILSGYGNRVAASMINALCSHTYTNNMGFSCNTTHKNVIPVIVKYQGKVYVALKLWGNSGSVTLVGMAYDILQTPMVVNDRNGLNVADLEIIYTGEVIGATS